MFGANFSYRHICYVQVIQNVVLKFLTSTPQPSSHWDNIVHRLQSRF